MTMFAKPLGYTLAAAMFIGLVAPGSAEACWWLFRKTGNTNPAPEAPAPGPAPEVVFVPPPAVFIPPPIAFVPPPQGRTEECAIENKGLVGNTVKSNRRWVEAVYEVRTKHQYTPPVLGTRTREVDCAAVYQTAYRQEWVAAEFTTVCRKEFHPATFRTVCREVAEEAQYRDISVRKYVPPVIKCENIVRCIPDGRGGFTSVDDVKFTIVSQGRFENATERKLVAESGSRMVFETLQDKPGYFIERIENVMVKPGMYRTVEDRIMIKEAHKELIVETVELKEGRLETVEEKVLVRPGIWEEAPAELVRNPC